MEELLIVTIGVGTALPLVSNYLFKTGPRGVSSSLLYASGYLVGNWALIQLGVDETLASLNLTQHLILWGIIFCSSLLTTEILERFGLIRTK